MGEVIEIGNAVYPYTKKQDSRLRKEFGISLRQYYFLLEGQDHKCACCGRHEEYNVKCGLPQKLAVDHCHDTKTVRGLLCWHCNTAIGRLGDTLEGVQKAIDFLKRKLPVLVELDEVRPDMPWNERPRKCVEVTTPDGLQFGTLGEAALQYKVHLVTIRNWCGMNKNNPHQKKDGWTARMYVK